MKRLYTYGRGAALTVLALAALPGCGGPVPAPAGDAHVPEPLNLLLPKRMRIHPFSDVITAPNAAQQIEVRIEAVDAFGDATKIFGDFRFEVYTVRPMSTDRRGRLIETWEASIVTGKTNVIHWDGITRTYLFKLDWDKPPAGKQPFVMRAVFTSPFTRRLIAEKTFERD